MPELEFYMNEQDEWRFIESMLSLDAWIVPDLRYVTAEFRVIGDLDSYLEARVQTRIFFLLHDDWYAAPLEMHEFIWQHDGNRYYSVMPRYGGPTIELEFCNHYEKQGKLFLTSGSVSYYTWYWDTRLNERRTPPDNLKRLFGKMCAMIKGGARVALTKKARRKYLICSGAAQEVDLGRLRLGGVFENK